MKDENCIFCKIANGEIPSRTLYEDDDFRVILDLNPATKGHALILPREHYQNLYEIEDSTASKVLPLAKKMAVMMTEKLGCDGFNVVQNNNEIAGQTVFHFSCAPDPALQRRRAVARHAALRHDSRTAGRGEG